MMSWISVDAILIIILQNYSIGFDVHSQIGISIEVVGDPQEAKHEEWFCDFERER